MVLKDVVLNLNGKIMVRVLVVLPNSSPSSHVYVKAYPTLYALLYYVKFQIVDKL